jgi:GxxExxY protein
MPITGPLGFHSINQEEFAKLDYRVMRVAFECQNELGRLCEEAIYQNDMAARLKAAGILAAREVSVTVTHRDFQKTYSLDLLVANAGIYEFKTAHSLAGPHEAQLLNYLFLCGARHGKLVNFRPVQVESRFVNTTLTHDERRRFEVDTEAWLERDQADRIFRENILGLLDDWGSWLDLELYTEALIHFAGGEGLVVQRLPLARDDASLGTQCFHLLNPETAFRVTAITAGTAKYAHNLRAMLRLSPLRTLQWVNLGRQKIQLVTLAR